MGRIGREKMSKGGCGVRVVILGGGSVQVIVPDGGGVDVQEAQAAARMDRPRHAVVVRCKKKKKGAADEPAGEPGLEEGGDPHQDSNPIRNFPIWPFDSKD
uniref:Uncharacterized protein n=1 Tax=Oryza sativa subsp. japonica TaxID=39947 RepID=Q8H3Q3_ORYSJ|nr:hypothetical protein [Oryza sativa Japonica Group]